MSGDWKCGRCGHLYLDFKTPSCECAGDPPVDTASQDHWRWGRVVERLRRWAR